MAKSTITVEGFVSKDPEVREAGAHRIITVTVPEEQGRMKDGQWVPDTDQQGNKIVHWWQAEFWNEYGDEIAKAVRKGTLVTVTGSPRPRAYLKNDGTVGISNTIANGTLAVVVRRPARGGGNGGGSGGPATQQAQEAWGAPQGDPGAGGGFDADGFNERPF